ncbi:AAA family ATPase [Rubneribacter sp.]|nr:AAA family ATPase [Candidatus Rubneribacter avistercoris]
MAQAARKCPVGVQVFKDIRNRNLMYVDKTRYIYGLAHLGGRYVLLSRPQRFGKTLLVLCGMGCLATGFFPPFC